MIEKGAAENTMEFEHVKPMDIEKRSMEIIGQELAEKGITLPAIPLPDHVRSKQLPDSVDAAPETQADASD